MEKKSGLEELAASEKSNASAPSINPHEHTSIYKKNEKTGEWEVKNPSGSIAYNYLYRNNFEED